MKITIDNEEVLCDKNFTIEEEMLNTSSVILNNVYPATWEQDKDYVSRFYYPKDYSKCKIFNEIVHPTTREDAEGTNFSIEVDTTKQYQVQTLKGQTSQSGTPTPTNPVPINITTGRQEIDIRQGKNLIIPEKTYIGKVISTTLNEPLKLENNDAWTTIIDYIPVEYGKTYVMSRSENGNGQFVFAQFDENKNMIARDNRALYTTNYLSYTINNQNTKYLMVGYREDYAHDNIQLEEGTTPTNYEQPKNKMYEINLGKNLLPISDITNITGLTNNGDSITLNGTFSSTSWTLSNKITLLANTTYTLSLSNYVNDQSCTDRVILRNGSTNITHIYFRGGSVSYTPTQDTIIDTIRFYSNGYSFSDYTFSIQLEKGIVASSFSPYKTPIYLGEMRNTNNVVIAKDYIFRNTTENPLYDSTLEEGQWYIHKEIGRVVLDGTQTIGNSEANVGGLTQYRCYYNNAELFNNNSNVLCNYLTPIASGVSMYSATYSNSINVFQTSRLQMKIDYTIFGGTSSDSNNTLNSKFKTWLSSNNLIVYFNLITPTNTLIEDEELINQLNIIELLEGLNNVSVSSPYLPFVMSLMYNYQEGYTEEDMLFCGVVENTGNISLNPRHPHYCNLQVLDFKTFLSEGETLDFVIYEKTILEAINQVIGTISDYGFILGNVNILHSDDVIGAYSTKDKTAYDVFNYIADITQSRWTTRMVDENTVAIDFYDPSLMPQGTAIEYTQEWFCDNKIMDMSFSYSSRDYRNKQVMLSGEVYANIETTEIIVADGYQTQFNTTGKIGYVSSLLLNGNPATIITKEEYDLGYEGDFIYQPGNTYFESVNLVSTGAIITIVYFAIIEGREVVLNQEEISRVSEMIDRKGVIARYENRNDATTTQELQAIGQSYLKYKGNPEVLLKVETLDNIWNIGERVSFTAPLTELTTEYMVKKKTINYITTQDNIFYTYELSSSFNSETEINYFDNQRSKMMGNIGAGEYISRNIDIENTANVIFYDLEVNEVVIDGDSTLQSELQAPLGVE